MNESELIHDLIKIFDFLMKWSKSKVPYFEIFCLGGKAFVKNPFQAISVRPCLLLGIGCAKIGLIEETKLWLTYSTDI